MAVAEDVVPADAVVADADLAAEADVADRAVVAAIVALAAAVVVVINSLVQLSFQIEQRAHRKDCALCFWSTLRRGSDRRSSFNAVCPV